MPLPPSAKSRNASPSAFQKTLLAQAVAVALTTLAVPSTSALAADICLGVPPGPTTTTINTVQSTADNCLLGAGESLNVVAPGSIAPTSGDAVNVNGTVAGSISNSGTISSANTGIRVARFTHTQSSFGAEFDSLSDMVSFGVAPALVVGAVFGFCCVCFVGLCDVGGGA